MRPGARVLGRDADAGRLAAEIVVQEAEPRDPTGLDRPPRHLVGRVPRAVVAERAEAQGARAERTRPLREAREPLEVRIEPVGIIEALPDERHVRVTLGDGHARRHEAANEVVLADRERRDRLRQRVPRPQERRAGRGEVSGLGAIGSLPEVDRRDDLRDHEVQVEVALAVGVGARVDRDAVEVGGEVGAVVEVEAAQEELVRLAGAGVLGGDQAGHGLEQLADPVDGAQLEVEPADAPFRGRVRLPDLGLPTSVDDHRLDGGLLAVAMCVDTRGRTEAATNRTAQHAIGRPAERRRAARRRKGIDCLVRFDSILRCRGARPLRGAACATRAC